MISSIIKPDGQDVAQLTAQIKRHLRFADYVIVPRILLEEARGDSILNADAKAQSIAASVNAKSEYDRDKDSWQFTAVLPEMV